jgi:quercetin dioxygenase-like cupin family protein
MHTMTTVSEIINRLKKDGYTENFHLKGNSLLCRNNTLQIQIGEFAIDRHYRFEGISDPGDEAVVYAISSPKYKIKGTLVNGYGIYSDPIADDMIKALNEYLELTSVKDENAGKEEKFNQATSQRPLGDRPLDAPMVIMNLKSFREQIKQEQAWKNSDRNSITIFKSDTMRIVLIALHAGAEMKKHKAPGIISIQVLEGEVTFRTDQQTARLMEGQVLTLHAEIQHSVFAEKEAVFLLTLANT